MKMRSIAVLAVVCLSLVSGLAIGGDKTRVIKWTREIENRQKIDEQAQIFDGEQILMMSTDTALNKHGYQRSESWHDYKTNLLAIKFIDAARGAKPACFLSNVKKSYRDTLADLKEREGRTIPGEGDRKFVVESGEIVEPPSSSIKKFCQDSPIYKLRESHLQQGVPSGARTPIVPNIVRTMCFYGPVDIFFPYKLLEIVFLIFPIFNL